jgi:hypothetical protein
MLELTASGDLEHVGVATPDGSRSYVIFYGHLQGKSINSSLVMSQESLQLQMNPCLVLDRENVVRCRAAIPTVRQCICHRAASSLAIPTGHQCGEATTQGQNHNCCDSSSRKSAPSTRCDGTVHPGHKLTVECCIHDRMEGCCWLAFVPEGVVTRTSFTEKRRTKELANNVPIHQLYSPRRVGSYPPYQRCNM